MYAVIIQGVVDIIKGIPKTEKIWVKQTTTNGDIYYITSKETDRSMYYLYKLEGDKAVKLAKAKSPLDFDEKLKIR